MLYNLVFINFFILKDFSMNFLFSEKSKFSVLERDTLFLYPSYKLKSTHGLFELYYFYLPLSGAQLGLSDVGGGSAQRA